MAAGVWITREIVEIESLIEQAQEKALALAMRIESLDGPEAKAMREGLVGAHDALGPARERAVAAIKASTDRLS